MTLNHPLCDDKVLGDLRGMLPGLEIRIVDHDAVEVVDPPVTARRMIHPTEAWIPEYLTVEIRDGARFHSNTGESTWPQRLKLVVDEAMHCRRRLALMERVKAAVAEADLPTGWFEVADLPQQDGVGVRSHGVRVKGVFLPSGATDAQVEGIVSHLRLQVELVVREAVWVISSVVQLSRSGAALVAAAQGPGESQMFRLLAADQAHMALSLAGFDGDLLTQVGAALAQLDGGGK